MTKISLSALTLVTIAIAVPFTIAGCGNSSASSSGAASEANEAGGPVATSPFEIEGDGPVDVNVAIDRTAVLKGSPALATRYKQAIQNAAELAITRGGVLRVVAFGRVAAEAVPVYERTDIPTLKDAGAAGRDDQALRDELAQQLDVALGLAPANQVAKAELERITARSGSDIARAVSRTIDAAVADPAAEKIVLVLTDGFVNQPGLKLSDLVADQLSSAEKSAVASQIVNDARSSSAADVQLHIRGLGQTSGAVAQDADLIDRLEEVWGKACPKLAKSCLARASL